LAAGCRADRKPGSTTVRTTTDAQPAEPSFASPEPPELVHLRLELEDDGALTLSFSLPGLVRFECHELKTRVERAADRVDIVVLGVVRLDPDSAEGRDCRMVKEPPPFKGQVRLPVSGRHRVAFHWGSHVDRYTLAVAPESFEFTAAGQPGFTEASQAGRYLRAGADWLWVTVWFLGPTAAQRLGGKRDALLHDLEALGARPFEPVPGRYFLNGGSVYVPRSAGPVTNDEQRTEEPRFLHWSGDWKPVEAVLARYKKYNPPVQYRGNNMMVWLNQPHRHASTY
jgi:hypothetical protein